MVSQRERLKERGMTQVSVWLPDSTVERMKALALARDLSLPKLIESALLALEQSPDEPSPVSVPGTDALANMRAALAELHRRVSLLESTAKTAPGGARSDVASTPYLEENPAEKADSAAVVALESRADISAVPNEAVGVATEKPDLAALIDSIPKADFVSGGNEQRNRRILELHVEGKGISQISRVLLDEGVPNSRASSVEYFFKKNHIAPNKPGRWSK